MIFVVLLILTASVAATPTNDFANELLSEFMEIGKLYPVEELTALAIVHYSTDPCFEAAIDYINSPKFRDMLNRILTSQRFQLIMFKIQTQLIEFDLDSKVTKREVLCERPSFGKFLSEAEELIPFEEIYFVVLEKIRATPVLTKFYEYMSSAEMRDSVMELIKGHDVQLVLEELRMMDVPVDRYLNEVYKFFNWI